jgi:photosystem II stability/assembly factor-like uncharacterized protein
MRKLSALLLLVAAACSHAPRERMATRSAGEQTPARIPQKTRALKDAPGSALREAIATAGEERERFDDPDAAAALYALKRAGSADPQAAYAAARARMKAMARNRIATDALTSETPIGVWTFLGPGNIGGRTRALLIDPNNTNVMYAGAVSGGIWKTTDAGARWSPVGDLLVNLDVSSLAFDPKNTQILYAGTGEGYFREDIRGTALPLRGNGIFVTHNAGGSWEQLPSTRGVDFQWVNDVAVSSHDSNRLYAATRTGVWRSLDAGATWRNILPLTVKGGCLDLALRPGAAGDFLFASCGVLEQATVYRATNAETDTPFTAVFSQPGMSRTSLAIAPSNPSIVYAMAADFDQQLLGVYRSDSNGDPGTWQPRVTRTDPVLQNTMLLTNPIAPLCGNPNNRTPMGWHCNVIAVDPVDPQRVWAAGVDLFRSDDGGHTWGLASYWWADPGTPTFVHADQHVIAFDPHYDGTSNRTLFATNDGGVFRTDNARGPVALGANAACDPVNAGMVWHSLNHLYGATQFYHGAVTPDGRTYLGGAQDNGTVFGTPSLGIDGWLMQAGGDGGFVAVDPVVPSTVYAESQNGFLQKSVDGGQTFDLFTDGLHDEFLFITPFLIDPNQHDRLWIGGRRFWRRDSGSTTWTGVAGLPLAGQVSAIAVATGRPDHLLGGTSAGELLRTDNATANPALVSWTRALPRSGFVSSVTFDPANDALAYATYAGFGGGAHVWKTIDGGTTWAPLDGTEEGALPDIPMHSLAVDPTRPGRLFLGSDLGLFVSTDGGAHWTAENSGFASVITESVFIGPGALGPALYAFTHGRGAWRAELTTPKRRRAL